MGQFSKLLQLKLLDLVASRAGCALVVLLVCLCVHSALQLVHVLATGHYSAAVECVSHTVSFDGHFAPDELGAGRASYVPSASSPAPATWTRSPSVSDVGDAANGGVGPIDMVYTWVNGSDPWHQRLLARHLRVVARQRAVNAAADVVAHLRDRVHEAVARYNRSLAPPVDDDADDGSGDSGSSWDGAPRDQTHGSVDLAQAAAAVGAAELAVEAAQNRTLLHAAVCSAAPSPLSDADFGGGPGGNDDDAVYDYSEYEPAGELEDAEDDDQALDERMSSRADRSSSTTLFMLTEALKTGTSVDLGQLCQWMTASFGEPLFAVGGGKAAAAAAPPGAMSADQPPDEEASMSRFIDNEELKYSLRSVEQFAPWIRHIYLVTNGQVPAWLDVRAPGITVVTHEQIFPNRSHLPTFSSPAIEVHLHRIPGLSRRFLYMNDDVMFGAPVYPSDFFSPTDGQKIYLAWDVPNCEEGCPSSWIGDGYCDLPCNTTSCGFDAGDCANQTAPAWGGAGGSWGNNNWGGGWNGGMEQTGGSSPNCAPGCPDSWIGDVYCDRMCQSADCGFDGGDCDVRELRQQIDGFLVGGPAHGESVGGEGGGSYGGAGARRRRARRRARARRSKTAVSGGDEHVSILANGSSVAVTAIPVDSRAAVWFSLRPLVKGDGKILSASHNSSELVRAATVLQSKKMLVMSFRNAGGTPPAVVSVELEYELPTGLSNGSRSDAGAAGGAEAGADAEAPAEEPTPASSSLRFEFFLRIGNASVAVASATAGSDGPSLVDMETGGTDGALHDKSAADDVGGDEAGSPWDYDTATGGAEGSDVQDGLGDGAFGEEAREQDELLEQNGDQDQKGFDSEVRLKRGRGHGGVSGSAGTDADGRNEAAGADDPIDDVGGEGHRKLLGYRGRRDALRHTTGRRLLDTFGDSLKFVNALYTRKFGAAARRVPSHMPHFIDGEIMSELQATFPAEFEATSSHQLRAADDMQFAFSYMYYVTHARRDDAFLDAEWRRFVDTDNNGALNWNELRTLAAIVYGVPLGPRDVGRMRDQLLSCNAPDAITGSAAEEGEPLGQAAEPGAAAEPTISWSEWLAKFDEKHAHWADHRQEQPAAADDQDADAEGERQGSAAPPTGRALLGYLDRSVPLSVRLKRLREERERLNRAKAAAGGGESAASAGTSAAAGDGSGGARPAAMMRVSELLGKSWTAAPDGDPAPSPVAAPGDEWPVAPTSAPVDGGDGGPPRWDDWKDNWPGGDGEPEEAEPEPEEEADESLLLPLHLVYSCDSIVNKLREHYGERTSKYPHSDGDTSHVAFLMISTNDTKLLERLDGIRVRRQKFVCLNDNMDHSDPHNAQSLARVQTFYRALYPIPSRFELPGGRRNARLHVPGLDVDAGQRGDDDGDVVGGDDTVDNVDWGRTDYFSGSQKTMSPGAAADPWLPLPSPWSVAIVLLGFVVVLIAVFLLMRARRQAGIRLRRGRQMWWRSLL